MNIPANITLTQFEQIDGLRRSMLYAINGLPAHACVRPSDMNPDPRREVQLESRLYDALIDLLGYDAASEIASVGDYADELITNCLIGATEVCDEVSA